MAIESRSASASVPGLDHLRSHVQHWEEAIRTLSFTATALAESVGAAVPSTPATPPSDKEPDQRGAQPDSNPVLAPAPTRLLLRPPPGPPLRVPPGQLKPGRLFIVANLQGAYYTLLELLSRHKFDFRCDNLLHVGNLLAPPPPLPPSPPPSAAAADGGGGGSDRYGLQPTLQAPRRFRNSSSVLKLLRRHGGLGPMGGNECLALLAAARCNRQRAEQRAAAAATEEEERGRGAGALQPPRGRCSALSLQLAAAKVGSAARPPVVPLQRSSEGGRRSSVPASAAASRRSLGLGLGLAGSDSSDSSGGSEDSDVAGGARGEADLEMVDAPLTPHPDNDDHGDGDGDDDVPARSSHLVPSSPRAPPAGPAAGSWCGAGAGASLDDADLAALLSMPTSVVLEAYGMQLQHAGPLADGSEAAAALTAAALPSPMRPAVAAGGRYHVLFSHRRPGGRGGSGGGGGDSTATGLASCRSDVVRFAVLPPLATLLRRSPGFGAAIAAAAAPNRADLLMELLLEPLSELDA